MVDGDFDNLVVKNLFRVTGKSNSNVMTVNEKGESVLRVCSNVPDANNHSMAEIMLLTHCPDGVDHNGWGVFAAGANGAWGVKPNAFEIWEYPATKSRLQILPGGNTILTPSGGEVTLNGGVMSNPGRMHLSGDELLYLLNKQGVIIGKEWGGNDNLTVEGDIDVVGDVRLLGADCAEEFDVYEDKQIEPGTVLVIGEDGGLQPSKKPFDKRVAGVVSGAKGYRPGIVLDKRSSANKRLPIALTGKTYCKVDAKQALIEVGDLLTTSSTVGHAMKSDDPMKAFGAVIGKSLGSLEYGTGLIPILVALQ